MDEEPHGSGDTRDRHWSRLVARDVATAVVLTLTALALLAVTATKAPSRPDTRTTQPPIIL